MMMLEKGTECSTKNVGEKEDIVKNAKTTGEHNRLTHTPRVKPITPHNSYGVFQFEADSDDDSDGDEDEEITDDSQTYTQLDRRQRE